METSETADTHSLVHVHICTSCGRVSRRDEPDGTPDARGGLSLLRLRPRRAAQHPNRF